MKCPSTHKLDKIYRSTPITHLSVMPDGFIAELEEVIEFAKYAERELEKACKRIQDLQDEIGPLREMQKYTSTRFRDQGGQADSWGSIYGEILAVWAKARAKARS